MKKISTLVVFILMSLFCLNKASSSVMPPHKKIDFNTNVAFTDDERRWFKENTTLRVGVLENFYPYEYYDNKKQYKGIASTYLYEIERETGILVELVPFEQPDDLVEAIINNKIDSFSFAIGDDYEGFVVSDAYINLSLGIFTNPDNKLLINSFDDLAGKKIAVLKFLKEDVLPQIEDIEIIKVDTVLDGIKGVNLNYYDAFVGDIFQTKSVIFKSGLDNIHLSSSLGENYGIGIALSNNKTAFLPVVNKILSKFNKGNRSEVLEMWTKNNSDLPDKIEQEYKLYLFVVSFIFLSVVAFLFLWLLQIRRHSKRINELRKDYKNLFDKTPVAMFVFKGEKIIYVNEAFAELIGEDAKKLLNSKSFGFINASFIKPMREAKDTQEDLKVYNLRGEVKYINIKNISIPVGNEVQELVIVVDVTYRKTLEDERRDILKKVSSIQKMESVGLLASKVAHDFNNILAGINGAAEYMVLNMDAKNSLIKYPKIIVNACSRAAYLTRQLLFFAKDKSQVLKNMDINECVRSGVALLEQTISNKKNVVVDLNIEAKDGNILGNENLLENIIINLGINSRDALPKENGKIAISTRNVHLSKDEIGKTVFDVAEGNFVELTIEDNGMGIPYELQSKVFEPFFTTKSDKGNGLGLFAVYGVIREHNATLKLESISSKGTKISIYFPLSKVKKKVKEVKKVRAKIDAKILVVDDEEMLLTLLKDILEFLGAEVLTAGNYDDAVRIYEENKKSIKLVMLDVVMPGKSGLDVYKALKDINKSVKAIFMSGYNSNEEINDMIPKNKNLGFVAKPYDVSDISSKISEILGS